MSIEDQEAQMQAAVTQAISGLIQSKGAEGDDYATARSTFRLMSAPDPKTGVITNSQGWMLYPNGTIVTDTGVLYPTQAHGIDPADIAGTRQWAQKIQDTWSDEKANQWRKTLSDQGYEVAEKGGMAYDLINALSAYHENRYMNGGRVQPLAPQGAKPGELRIKDVVDPVALSEEIKGWGQVPFGDDLDPKTAEYFKDRVIQVAQRLMKNKDWDASRAVEGAGVRVQKEFLGDKNVSQAMEEQDDDEMDETLRESIVSVAQIASL